MDQIPSEMIWNQQMENRFLFWTMTMAIRLYYQYVNKFLCNNLPHGTAIPTLCTSKRQDIEGQLLIYVNTSLCPWCVKGKEIVGGIPDASLLSAAAARAVSVRWMVAGAAAAVALVPSTPAALEAPLASETAPLAPTCRLTAHSRLYIRPWCAFTSAMENFNG